MFAVDFAILEVHKGFIWVELADNIVLKVCGSHRILDFVIRCHRFASYFVVLECLVTTVGHISYFWNFTKEINYYCGVASL